MDSLTYSGVGTASEGDTLPTMTSGESSIAGTYEGGNGVAMVIVFTLLQKVDDAHQQATLQGSIASPAGQQALTTLSVTPTFNIGPGPPVTGAGLVIDILMPAASESSSDSWTPSAARTSDESTPVGAQSSTAGVSSAAITSSTAINDPNGSKGYSSGVLAGAAVGCLVIGLMIASLAGLLFSKRRNRSKSINSGMKGRRDVRETEWGFNAATGSSKPAWQTYVLQPESDQSLSRLASRTWDDVEMFVENFYVDQPLGPSDRTMVSEMQVFQSPYLGSTAIDFLTTSITPTAIIKHCMAYFLLLSINPMQDGSPRLLPKEFTLPAKGNPQLLSQIRVLTAQSQPALDQDEHYLTQRDRAAQTIFDQIERAFEPWARGTVQARAKSLKGVLIHLSELGVKLFSQPSDFEWRWVRNSPPSHDQVVILPGLDKTTDSKASPLAKPICIVEPRFGRPSG